MKRGPTFRVAKRSTNFVSFLGHLGRYHYLLAALITALRARGHPKHGFVRFPWTFLLSPLCGA
ncbi:MAG: hypothetical protein ACLQVM_18495, partial [Terriglobia bacterium]